MTVLLKSTYPSVTKQTLLLWLMPQEGTLVSITSQTQQLAAAKTALKEHVFYMMYVCTRTVIPGDSWLNAWNQSKSQSSWENTAFDWSTPENKANMDTGEWSISASQWNFLISAFEYTCWNEIPNSRNSMSSGRSCFSETSLQFHVPPASLHRMLQKVPQARCGSKYALS